MTAARTIQQECTWDNIEGMNIELESVSFLSITIQIYLDRMTVVVYLSSHSRHPFLNEA